MTVPTIASGSNAFTAAFDSKAASLKSTAKPHEGVEPRPRGKASGAGFNALSR